MRNGAPQKTDGTPKSLTALNAVGATFTGGAILEHAQEKTTQEATTEPTAWRVLEVMGKRPPEAIAEDVKDTYPDISLEDAQRIRDGLLAVLTAGTRAELNERGREYKALHTELKKRYGKSGKR